MSEIDIDEWDYPSSISRSTHPNNTNNNRAPTNNNSINRNNSSNGSMNGGSRSNYNSAQPQQRIGANAVASNNARNNARAMDSRRDDYDDDDGVDEGRGTKESEEPRPYFKIEMFDKGNLKYIASDGDIIVVLTEDWHAFFQSAKTGDKIRDYEIPHKPDEEVHKIFVDPTGFHALFSTKQGDTFYMHQSLSKLKKCEKLKGIVIESVGWDKELSTEASTGAILLGSNDGVIYEARFDSKNGLQSHKMVYDLRANAADNMPITGLEVEYFVSPRSSRFNGTPKYFVMATTPCRYYQFIGGPTFEAMFTGYLGEPHFIEMLAGNVPSSELHFYRKSRFSRPESFAWTTAAGIYHGTLVFEDQQVRDSVIAEKQLIPWSTIFASGSNSPTHLEDVPTPISIAITQFHMILMYKDSVKIIMQPPGLCNRKGSNSPPPKIVFEENWDTKQHGQLKGLTTDIKTGTIWLYTRSRIFEIVKYNEDADVWKLYLARAMDPTHPSPAHFDIALALCKSDPLKREKVLTSKAEYHFERKEFKKSAVVYAKTKRGFEEITLKFLNIDQRDALKVYLLKRLKIMKKRAAKSRNKEATQLNCLCTWLTEIYLDKLTELHESIRRKKNVEDIKPYNTVLGQFNKFLKENKEYLNPGTTFDLISSHGLMDEVLNYALLIEDYERVISYYVTQKEYSKALEILAKNCNKPSAQNEDLFYNFSPVLMNHIPVETVNTWMNCTFLNPGKLIPALMRYDPRSQNSAKTKENQVIRYLQFCVRKLKNKDPSIHNLLVARYAEQEDDTQLILFLNTENDVNVNPHENYYDPKYALRVCKENNKMQACVKLYSMMGLYEDAVDLALQMGDIELAKETAKIPEDDNILRKKLWLMIAKYVVEQKQDIKKAIEFLGESDLKLEDILPYFPNFSVIDDMKEHICKALENYTLEIEELKKEMDEVTANADLVRSDIKDTRHTYGYIPPNEKCNICEGQIMAREFYLFPCCHKFHSDCLMRMITRHSSQAKCQRINELATSVKKLKVLLEHQTASSAPPASSSSGPIPPPPPPDVDQMLQRASSLSSMSSSSSHGSHASQQLEEVRNELDELIAGECPYCGDFIIRLVDQSFINGGDPQDENELKSWSLDNIVKNSMDALL